MIDAPRDPKPGQELHLGAAVLRVLAPTPRCVVPGLEIQEPSVDQTLLVTLVQHYHMELPGFGRATCFGTYAEVVRPGQIRVGQEVQ